MRSLSAVTATVLMLVAQHATIVKVLLRNLGDKLPKHFAYLAEHLMEALTTGAVNPEVLARAKKGHRRANVFTDYSDEANYVLDTVALVMATAGRGGTEAGSVINKLAALHGFEVSEEDAFEKRLFRCLDTLDDLRNNKLTGEKGGTMVAEWVMSTQGLAALGYSGEGKALIDECSMVLADICRRTDIDGVRLALGPLREALAAYTK